MSCDEWQWQTSTCVWDHVCHLHCSMLTNWENISVQIEIMSKYILLYETLLNFPWQPPEWHVVRQADGSTTLKMSCNNPPVTCSGELCGVFTRWQHRETRSKTTLCFRNPRLILFGSVVWIVKMSIYLL